MFEDAGVRRFLGADEPEPEAEPEPEPEVDSEIDSNAPEKPDESVSDSGDSQSSGGLTTGQFIKVALGVLTLIAGAFLVTLMIRVRHQDDEGKFA